MLHQILFLAFYLGLLPLVLLSPFAGVLIYYWLDWLPPGQVYSVTLLPDYLSFITGALAFAMWLVSEKKTMPRATLVLLFMGGFLIWINITWQFTLAPTAGWFLWDRTVKVVGFAVLTALMLSTRERLEAFVWGFVLSVAYFAVPSAIKVIVSGGSGGIGAGEVVVGAYGSLFSDRVIISVVMAMAMPFALYLGRHAMLLPLRWAGILWPGMLGVAGVCLIASIGTFARTAVFACGATLLMFWVRARRKLVALLALAATILIMLAIAPGNWFTRMGLIAHYQSDDSALSRLSAWEWAWHFTLQHPIFGGGFGVFHLDAGSIAGRPGWLEAHNILFEVMAEHGFVGLGIFCCLILAIYRSCAIVQGQAHGNQALSWAADLARAIQISLAGYVAGGMFVSIATTPFLYILAAIAIGTRGLVERELPSDTCANMALRTPSRRCVS